jgi:hypothetical protein
MGWGGAVKEGISNVFGLIRQPIRRKEMRKRKQRETERGEKEMGEGEKGIRRGARERKNGRGGGKATKNT